MQGINEAFQRGMNEKGQVINEKVIVLPLLNDFVRITGTISEIAEVSVSYFIFPYFI